MNNPSFGHDRNIYEGLFLIIKLTYGPYFLLLQRQGKIWPFY